MAEIGPCKRHGSADTGVLTRWGKFNLIGAAGMGLQLAVLALLNRLAPGHYLLATAAAVEVTLLHNFFWHLKFTWNDCRSGASVTRQLIRFHAANGAVSLLGNLVLMRVLVQQAHVPVLAANLMAILVCSMVNFGLGHRWVFA